MADAIDLAKLKARMTNILKSQACRQIRFKLDGIHIQTFMYGYIAGRIDTGHVRVQIGNADYGDIDRDRHTWIVTLSSANAAPKTIVHECTHALIWATNAGVTVPRETHEAAAYMAESMYALLTGGSIDTEVDGLDRVVGPLARRAIEFNNAHNTSSPFVCPPSDVELMKAIYKRTPLWSEDNRTQGGLGDDRPRLPAWVQGWWTVSDGTNWYYHFSASAVAVTKIKPTSASAPAPSSPDRGRVDISPVTAPHVVVSWSPGEPGGTVEKFTRVGITKMEGVSNNASPRLVASKMT